MAKSKTQNNTKKASIMQQRFAVEYFKTGKKEESAIKAGYSPKSAGSQASQQLNNPKVQEILRGLEENLAIESSVTPLMIVLELKKIAFGNIYDIRKKIKKAEELTADEKACIQSIKEKSSQMNNGNSYELDLKGYSKESALNSLWDKLGFNRAIEANSNTAPVINLNLAKVPEKGLKSDYK